MLEATFIYSLSPSNRPRSIYQYSSMAPRLSGQNCKYFKFLLSLNSQKRLRYKENNTKYRSLTWKPRSHVIYRTWPIACACSERTNQNSSKLTTPLASMCRAIPCSARALKVNIFLWRWYCRKKHKRKNRNMVYRGLYSYWQRVRFIRTFFSYCFCMLSDFAKVFGRKVWRVQVAHLNNAARALSSPSQCFQLSTNLGKDFFRYVSVKSKLKHPPLGQPPRIWIFEKCLFKFPTPEAEKLFKCPS